MHRFIMLGTHHTRSSRCILLLLLASMGCGQDGDLDPLRQGVANVGSNEDAGTSVVFRMPQGGGDAKLYRLPEMIEVSWQFDAGNRSVGSIVGFASDDDLIFSLVGPDSAGGFDLVGLDLVTGRTRTVDTNVALATVGPTGRAYVVGTDRTIGEVDQSGRIEEWGDTLLQAPTKIWGAQRNRIVATTSDSSRELLLLSQGQTPIRQQIPIGPITISKWGRFVVVATDSGLATFDPLEPASTGFVPLAPSPNHVILSPSGHLIYAVKDKRHLVSVERFHTDVRRELQLPGPVGDLRMGPLGRILLAQSAVADSTWIIDLTKLRMVKTVPGSWDDDLPAVAPDGSVLTRLGETVVTLATGTFEPMESVTASAKDRWIVTRWDPRRPALELASDSAETTEQPNQIMYVQVSSSRNPAWADDLARELRDAGMDASVLRPDSTDFSVDELYRVVLGPYTSRDEAEGEGRKLGRSFFIITREILRPEIH